MSVIVLFFVACAGSAYLPGEPGSASSDISGRDVRDAWLAEHPEIDDDTRIAVESGVFIPGMTVETRDLITNSDRRDSTGNGYWRSRKVGDEVRYQWFVGGERAPFKDGSGDLVCELTFVAQSLREVKYCGSED
ncbi:MAG: hypothetical protein P8049_07435 [Gemmatimonadota bacterium]